MSKAFDNVDHNGLFAKLEKKGFKGLALALLQSYNSNGLLYVGIREYVVGTSPKNHHSNTFKWNQGVPQGSLLGPYMFLVTMDDLPEFVLDELEAIFSKESIMSLYADDINHSISHKELQVLSEMGQKSIELVKTWCNSNSLKLNQSKTSLIHFHSSYVTPNQSPEILIDGQRIEESDSVSFLGLKINSTLSWNDHVDHVCKKMRCGVYALGSLRDTLSIDVLRMVYFAHVFSHLRNNIIFWGHSSDMQRVFVLQKRALRTICRKNPRESCRPLFEQLKILTVPCVYILECNMFVKKYSELFDKNEEVHSHDTRSKSDLRVLRHSSSLFSKSPQYRLRMLYNKLPQEIKIVKDIYEFKSQVSSLLLKSNYYTVNEFFA